MPSDLLQVDLAGTPRFHCRRSSVDLRPADSALSAALAAAYFEAYPPEIGAATLSEAIEEMNETFRNGFGRLVESASFVAFEDGAPAGAVFVVERSMWDEDLEGPFVIDLFVRPRHQGKGIGRELMAAAMAACAGLGEPALSLRIGDGTSSPALALYRDLGFRALA